MRRRTFLKTALKATVAATAGTGALAALTRGAVQAAPGAPPARVALPDGFLWGCSTSAYQIEGAVTEDGRGPSVWDTYSHSFGRTVDGDTGDIACDHYHRYAEDVELMARAGMRAYRFSIAWPRVLPLGTGTVNPKGLDFYDRLTDTLLARGIEPWPCLFHWDLPQALQDKGGWTNRDIAGWFTDYALAVTARLGDRAKHWAMLNEPSVVAIFGHGTGGHAPGMTGRVNCLKAIHHQNLAQGTALAALRAAGATAKGWQLGTVLSLQPSWPVGGLDSNYPASLMWDAVWNRSCLDPLIKGRYPELLEADFARIIKPDDLARIRQPVDFLGVNYYSRMHQQPDPQGLFGTGYGSPPEGTRKTAMDWPVEPDGLAEILVELQESYGNPPVYVTENGADYPDSVGPGGQVEDGDRIAYLRDHMLAAAKAIDEGCNVKGWMVWTLLDNFEWSEGYRRHFGLVQVDRKTLARKPKASYDWYASVIRNNAVPLA
ncbi:GH1 family beta-glucosidase [Azospirillum sp. TSO35-2]|uniref:GH1 family beta-glucosidase n=1 Tax=Azospirillum sp. TSO35-2 TaxID=716796 RepID=UPI000D608F6D|nr:GH1 family beta-glucosidase [Azospirillum sp. TSO35-2]PWC33196.1 beta-glucosidase [Azospirillum sp. TSO35-2]